MSNGDLTVKEPLYFSLSDFLQSTLRNSWVEAPGIAVYVRKTLRMYGESSGPCLDVANVEVHEELQGTSVFKRWLAEAEELARKDFDYLLIENAHNPILLPFALRNGFAQYWHGGSTYIKQIRFQIES